MAGLVRWNPLREMRRMDEVMDRFFNDPWFRWGQEESDGERLWRMPMDAYITDDAIVIQMAVPGIRPEDVNITLENNVLTISGELKPREEGRNYILRERPVGRFERVMSVSTPVDANKAEAAFENGVLTLTLPKAEQVKPKTIQVKTAPK